MLLISILVNVFQQILVMLNIHEKIYQHLFTPNPLIQYYQTLAKIHLNTCLNTEDGMICNGT